MGGGGGSRPNKAALSRRAVALVLTNNDNFGLIRRSLLLRRTLISTILQIDPKPTLQSGAYNQGLPESWEPRIIQPLVETDRAAPPLECGFTFGGAPPPRKNRADSGWMRGSPCCALSQSSPL